jgi:hypothetical protein
VLQLWSPFDLIWRHWGPRPGLGARDGISHYGFCLLPLMAEVCNASYVLNKTYIVLLLCLHFEFVAGLHRIASSLHRFCCRALLWTHVETGRWDNCCLRKAPPWHHTYPIHAHSTIYNLHETVWLTFPMTTATELQRNVAELRILCELAIQRTLFVYFLWQHLPHILWKLCQKCVDFSVVFLIPLPFKKYVLILYGASYDSFNILKRSIF